MVWNFNPVLVNFGPFKIHYYGVIFAIGIFIGYLLWRWQTKRQGFSEKQTEDFVIWAFLAVIIGARLGHCLFYEPDIYLKDPIRILKFYEGGLASHGATIALLLVLFFYHRIQNIRFLDVCDCFSFSAGVGATAVRIGNFFNSEIVGRITDVPWAIKFPRYELNPSPRHPSQLYEAILGCVVLLVLYLADRRYGTKRPRGLLSALFLVTYFGGRIFVEFFKEYQVPVVESYLNITMGQILSTPFFLGGLVLLIFVLKNPTSSEIINESKPVVIPLTNQKKKKNK